MSIVGILSGNFYSTNGAQDTAGAAQNSQKDHSKSQQIKAEFQQLGQDLQSGNLAQAQTDYATLSQNFQGASQGAGASGAVAAAAATTGAAPTAAVTATATAGAVKSASSAAQAFAQLGQDLQAGDLQASQQDFTNLQQSLQQNASQPVQGQHHRHHHAESSQSATSGSSAPQTNPISAAFGTLATDLQAGNLSGAQAAFATLQTALQQVGGFATPAGTSGTSSTPAAAYAGTLNVSA